jgi:hypothetical protein
MTHLDDGDGDDDDDDDDDDDGDGDDDDLSPLAALCAPSRCPRRPGVYKYSSYARRPDSRVQGCAELIFHV